MMMPGQDEEIPMQGVQFDPQGMPQGQQQVPLGHLQAPQPGMAQADQAMAQAGPAAAPRHPAPPLPGGPACPQGQGAQMMVGHPSGQPGGSSPNPNLAHSQSSPMMVDNQGGAGASGAQAGAQAGTSASFRNRCWTNENPNFRNRGYTERVFQTLNAFRRNDQLCDVVLIAGPSPEERAESESAEEAGRVELPAHRAILAACCPYFCAMFTGEMAESRQRTVYIQGLDARALSTLVHYMYSAEIHITEENVQILLPAASLLQLNEVKGACCDFLKSQLHPTNCLGIRAFADLHGCSDLFHYANAFTEQHFGELVFCEEFLSLTADQVGCLISSDKLTAPGEEKVFESVIQWVRHNPDQRRQYLASLMEFVRLPLLSQDYLLEKVDSEPLIKECPKCKDYLIEALKFHLLKSDQKIDFQSPRAKPRQPLGLPKLMVVIGGQAPKAIRNVDVYDFQSEKWLNVSELPQRRCRCGVAVQNGLVYAVGGFNGSLRVRTVDVYDPVGDLWVSSAAMEARRSTLGVAVLNGRIFAVGGFDGSTGLNSTEAFDPRSGEWGMTAAMSTRRSSVGVGVLEGCLYAVGGYDGQSRQCLSSVEKYDPRMDRWTPVTDMNTRRSGAGVTVIEGKLYAVGGHDGPVVKKSGEVYDPQLGYWKPVSDMSLCRRNAGVVSLNGELYAVGGDDGSSNLVSVEVFNPKTDAWAMLPSSMQLGRSYAGVAIINKTLP